METTNLLTKVFNFIIATLGMWIIPIPVYLPWVLSRFGKYKAWYWAPFIPPFSWRGWIQIWPASLGFLVAPLITFIPKPTNNGEDVGLLIWGAIGVIGFGLAIVMIIVNPRWAKPEWQRRLEDRYTYQEISGFIAIWRKAVPYEKWYELIETEEGMLELLDIATNY